MRFMRSIALIATLVAAVTLASAGRAEDRASIPERYKWRTTDLYPTVEAWEKARDEIRARIPRMTEFQGTLGQSAARFHTALKAWMDLDQDVSRLQSYANMLSDEDTRVGTTSAMNQEAQQLAVDFTSATSFARPEILALGEEKVNTFIVEEPGLAPFKPFLDEILRWAPHTLTPAEEKIASNAGMMAGNTARVYRTFTNADLPYPAVTLSTGQKVRIDAQAYTNYRASTNREDRDHVFQAFWSRYKDFERTLGTTLDGNVRSHMFNKTVRKFDSCLEAALFDANVPVSVYKQLIADVHANLPTLHRYLKLRQRMMGVDTLRYEDLYAPIVKRVEMKFTPEEATDLTLKAVAPLGPDYAAALKKGFDDRWVDFMPTTGKRSGAYSTGVYGVHPYQLLNFTGLYDDVSTLAHESGHSMHTHLSFQSQPYVTADHKIFVGEVASTLNENLLLHYMLGQTQDRDTRLFLLGSSLDGLRTTLFRQTLFAEFEMKIHEMAERGEPLTGEKLTALYLSMLQDYYADGRGVCRINPLYGIEWAYIPHFYYNFYVYQYATSIVASSSIATEMRAEKRGTRARDAYLTMLSSGSAKFPIDLLKDAGVDMTTSAPFAAAIAEMNSIMDEMEKLLAGDGKKKM